MPAHHDDPSAACVSARNLLRAGRLLERSERAAPDTCSKIQASVLFTATLWLADPHYCMYQFAGNLPTARQLAIAPNNDVFVSSDGKVVVVFDDNDDGVSDDNERSTFASAPGLNHGLALSATHVYASSPSTVYRWPYATGDRIATGPMETVITAVAPATRRVRC